MAFVGTLILVLGSVSALAIPAILFIMASNTYDLTWRIRYMRTAEKGRRPLPASADVLLVVSLFAVQILLCAAMLGAVAATLHLLGNIW